MDNKREIAERLTECLQARHGSEHGWKKSAALELGMQPQQISDLTSGRRTPGNKTQQLLREKDYDVTFIMTGETENDLNKKFEELVAKQKERNLSEEEWKIITTLRRLGISQMLDFNIYFDYPRAVNNKLSPVPLGRAAEKTSAKYKTEKVKRKA